MFFTSDLKRLEISPSMSVLILTRVLAGAWLTARTSLCPGCSHSGSSSVSKLHEGKTEFCSLTFGSKDDGRTTQNPNSSSHGARAFGLENVGEVLACILKMEECCLRLPDPVEALHSGDCAKSLKCENIPAILSQNQDLPRWIRPT